MDLEPNGGGALPSEAPGGTGIWVTQRLSGDRRAAGVLWWHGGNSLILKLMTKREQRTNMTAFMLASVLASVRLFLENFGISDSCGAALSRGLLGKR